MNKLFGSKPRSDRVMPNRWHEEYLEGNLPTATFEADVVCPFIQMTGPLQDLEPDTDSIARSDDTSTIAISDDTSTECTSGSSARRSLRMLDTLSPLQSRSVPSFSSLAAFAPMSNPDEQGPSLTERSDRSNTDRSGPGRLRVRV